MKEMKRRHRVEGGAFRGDVPSIIAKVDDVEVNRILDSSCIEDGGYDVCRAVAPPDVPLERENPSEAVEGH